MANKRDAKKTLFSLLRELKPKIMPKIEKIKFGNMEIDGKNYGGKDLYVSWDGKIEDETIVDLLENLLPGY